MAASMQKEANKNKQLPEIGKVYRLISGFPYGIHKEMGNPKSLDPISFIRIEDEFQVLEIKEIDKQIYAHIIVLGADIIGWILIYLPTWGSSMILNWKKVL